jgi:hypothetical protein
MYAPFVSTPAINTRTWKDRTYELFDQPLLLVILLSLARTLTFPYMGIFHDAQLYGLQVARRLSPEPYARDLFFQFGSQDQYSLFSLLVAPLAATIGLPIAFFVLYTLFSVILIAGEYRLLRRILPDQIAAAVALLMLAVGDIPYGGLGIFQVHEAFLTARLPATALAVWGLDLILGRRFNLGWLLLIAAAAIHPLMAIPAIALAFWWLIEGNSTARRWLLAAGSVVLIGTVWAIGVASGRLELMSADWLDTVRRISPQCFPTAWRMADFIYLGFALVTLILATLQGSTIQQKVARGTLLVGMVGLALTFAAQWSPIPILLQVQPYRALWLVEFFAIPLGIAQAARLWREPTPLSRLLSILLLFGLGRWRSPEGWEVGLFWPFAGVVVLTVIVGREIFLRQPSPHVKRRWASGMVGLFIASLLVGLFAMIPFFSMWDRLSVVADPFSIIAISLRATGNAIPLAIGTVILLAATQLPSRYRLATVLVLWAVATIATGYARRDFRAFEQDRDLEFVRSELAHLPATSTPEGWSIYWPTDVRNLWFGLESASYYHFAQVQGVIFQDVTAKEAARRLALVRPFEFRRLHFLGPLASRERLEPWLGIAGQGRPVLSQDLERLAQEPNLDLVILPYKVGDFHARSNGSVWIYDCRDIRTARGTLVRGHQEDQRDDFIEDRAEPISAPNQQ